MSTHLAAELNWILKMAFGGVGRSDNMTHADFSLQGYRLVSFNPGIGLDPGQVGVDKERSSILFIKETSTGDQHIDLIGHLQYQSGILTGRIDAIWYYGLEEQSPYVVLRYIDISVSDFLTLGGSGRSLDLILLSLNGNDEVQGSSGADTLVAGAGNDYIYPGDGADSLDGGAGDDLVQGADGHGPSDADTVLGLDGNDSVYGGADDDLLNGNKGADLVEGGVGNDTVYGGQGNDTVHGDASYFALREFLGSLAGDDVVNGNIGVDIVHGGRGNDTVYGGQDSDSVYGDEGNDLLSGDLGADILYGGQGADRFTIIANGGIDWIADFRAGEGDRILLAPGTSFAATLVSDQVAITLADGSILALAGVTTWSADWVVYG